MTRSDDDASAPYRQKSEDSVLIVSWMWSTLWWKARTLCILVLSIPAREGTGMPGQAARGGPRTPPASSADRRQEEAHLRRTTAARDPSQISSLQASSIIQQCPEFILCDCTQGGHALQQCSSERVGPLPTNKGIPFLNTEPGYTEAG